MNLCKKSPDNDIEIVFYSQIDAISVNRLNVRGTVLVSFLHIISLKINIVALGQDRAKCSLERRCYILNDCILMAHNPSLREQVWE